MAIAWARPTGIGAVQFEIDADAKPPFYFLRDDMVRRDMATRGDEHDALHDGFVIERAGARRHRDAGVGGDLRIAPETPSLIFAACSTRRLRATPITASPITSAPMLRNRSESREMTPGTSRIALSTCGARSPGAASSKVSIGPAPEAVTRDGDETRDAKGRESVALRKAVMDGGDADQRQDGGNKIGREMECVGREGLATLLARNRAQLPGAHEVDQNRGHEHAIGGPTGVDPHIGFAETPHGLADHDKGEAEEKAGFDESGERLIFTMSVMMFGVRRLLRLAHGVKRQRRRASVDKGVTGFREKSERAGPQSGGKLGGGQHRARSDRSPRGGELTAGGPGSERSRLGHGVFRWAGGGLSYQGGGGAANTPQRRMRPADVMMRTPTGSEA